MTSLRVDDHDVIRNPWAGRRALLEELGLKRTSARLSDVFDDGQVRFFVVRLESSSSLPIGLFQARD